MKKTLFLTGALSLLLTLAVYAQDSTGNSKPATQETVQPMTQDQKTNPAMGESTTQGQKKTGNPTVDSILGKYTLQPMPTQVTTEQVFPVIGQYQSSSNADQKVTVTLDDQNKGFAWVDGLPQGRVKAILKKSPATYKIPEQKTADGKDVPEGTLIYDKDTRMISILLGRPFNDQDPASVFANPSSTDQSMTTNDQMSNDQTKTEVTKSKTTKNGKMKVKEVAKPEPAPWVFTGTKIEQVTANNQ